MKRKEEGKFIKVRCPKCKNEQVIFGKSSSQVKCLSCNEVLAESGGGRAKIKGKILEIMN